MEKRMCERVGEDSRHGDMACDIHVDILCILLEHVSNCEHGIAFALRWGVALVGKFLY